MGPLVTLLVAAALVCPVAPGVVVPVAAGVAVPVAPDVDGSAAPRRSPSPETPTVPAIDPGALPSTPQAPRDTLDRLLEALEAEDPSPLGRLRVLYHRAAFDGDRIDEAERTLAGLLEGLPDGERAPPLFDAYAGGLDLLRARDGRWPPARLRYLRSGMARLDDAVLRAPDDLEIRYLRLAGEANLPGIFRRDDVVREDRGVLCGRVGADGSMPAALWGLVEAFACAGS